MKALRHLLLVALLLVTSLLARAGSKDAGNWAFYGFLLNPTVKGANPQWEPNGPSFSIIKPANSALIVPKPGCLLNAFAR